MNSSLGTAVCLVNTRICTAQMHMQLNGTAAYAADTPPHLVGSQSKPMLLDALLSQGTGGVDKDIQTSLQQCQGSERGPR